MSWHILTLIILCFFTINLIAYMPRYEQAHNIRRNVKYMDKVLKQYNNTDETDKKNAANETHVRDRFLQYRNKTWGGCQPFKIGDSIQEQLAIQLEKVIKIFEVINIQYTLGCGTLIGAMREHDVTKYEVDNDIFVSKTFKLTEDIRRTFFSHGLHIFKSSIYRICNTGLMDTIDVPWGKTYSTYTDLYNYLPQLYKCDNKKKITAGKIQSFDKIRIRNFSAIIPNKKQAIKYLDMMYGKWQKPIIENNWKSKVHKKFDKQ